LTPDAPADIIAVRGNPFQKFKLLEYPDLVLSGGRTIVNKFKHEMAEAEIECLFNWAEGTYPDLFAPSGSLTMDSSDYTYRHYSATNAYAGVSSVDNDFYYKAADGILKNVGPLSDWLTKADCK
jgi:hypothetical protein